MSRRRAPLRGYSIVELMMAVAILAIGVTGVIALHKVTSAANRHARNVAIATAIAQAWEEKLVADAASWNHPSPRRTTSDLADTTWLCGVNAACTGGNPGGGNGIWWRPHSSTPLRMGPGFDPLGNPVADADMGDAVFCTHLRLSWLYRDDTLMSGNGVVRAEVRVFWLREGGAGGVDATKPVCDASIAAASVGTTAGSYYFVHKASAIRQNTAP
ncbi:MAG: prepilin-type N-terminal cleavage/methylation domain-containing protein [Polyangiaceae bacterium]|nr:prepilin-type N-terminal cleavage/methylation domain-containing protein [Polyangiaceae bacterium]